MIDQGRYRGFINYSQVGKKWRTSHEAPLYLNTIREKEWIRAIPSDQGGGMRNGDLHAFSINLQEEARLWWSPPASALFHHSHKTEEAARITNHLTIGTSSSLSFLGKTSIPCRGARIKQETVLDLEKDCHLFYMDIWAPGRVGYDEKWQFGSLSGKLSLFLDRRLVYKENWELKKGEIPFSSFRDCRLWISMIAYGTEGEKTLDNQLRLFREQGMIFEHAGLAGGGRIAKGLGF